MKRSLAIVSLLSTLATTTLHAGPTASPARFGHHGGHGYHHGSSVKSEIKDVKILIEDAVMYAKQNRLKLAKLKLEMAEIEVMDLERSKTKLKVKNALSLALEKVYDNTLGPRQKKMFVLDCSKIAIQALDDLLDSMPGGGFGLKAEVQEAIQLADELVHVVSMERTRKALKKLNKINSVLMSVPSSYAADEAMMKVSRLKEKLKDDYIPHFRKVNITERISGKLIDLLTEIKQSLTRRGGKQVLGVTQGFDKWSSERQILRVGMDKGFMKKIKIKAVGSTLDIDKVKIIFGNGGIQESYGSFLTAGDAMTIDLNGNKRKIQKIVIIAKTASGGRGSYGAPLAKAKVIGLK